PDGDGVVGAEGGGVRAMVGDDELVGDAGWPDDRFASRQAAVRVEVVHCAVAGGGDQRAAQGVEGDHGHDGLSVNSDGASGVAGGWIEGADRTRESNGQAVAARVVGDASAAAV